MKTKFYFLLLLLCAAIATKAQTTIFSEGFEDVNNTIGSAVSSTILSEDFDDVSTLPASGWSKLNMSDPIGSETWRQGTDAIPAQAGGSTSSIQVGFRSVAGIGTISDWLFTPQKGIKNGDIIKFWTSSSSSFSYPDRLEVRMKTSGQIDNPFNSALDVGSYTKLLAEINPTLAVGGYPQTMTEYTIVVSGLTQEVNGSIAFRYFVTDGGQSTNSYLIAIDSFSVTRPANAQPWTKLNLSTPEGIHGLYQASFSSCCNYAQSGTLNSYLYAARIGGPSGVYNITLNNWLFTPTVSLHNGDIVKFWTKKVGLTINEYSNGMQVRLSTSGDSSSLPNSQTDVGSYSTLLTEINPTNAMMGYPAEWTEYSILISGLTGTTDCRIAFRFLHPSTPNFGTTTANVGSTAIDTFSIIRGGILSNPTFDLTSKIILSPNPVNDVFQLNLNESKDVAKLKVEVYDLNGRMIKSFEKATNYSIAELESGIYLVKVIDGNISETKRIVKQ